MSSATTSSAAAAPHLRLAGVTRLSLGGRGPKDAYVFDPHRLALPCWHLALEGSGPALLITLDRHFDLVPPKVPVPDRLVGLQAMDEFARWSLDVRNFDHILAAMEAGLIGDAVVIARAHPKGCFEGAVWTDSRGRAHRILEAPTLERAAEDFQTAAASTATRELSAALDQHPAVLLDIDLDCFTTLSDADPNTIVPWTQELIREFLMPAGSERFWEAVLEKTRALTLAREPYHCGGMIAAGRLFEDLCHVLFGELLKTGLP